MPLPVVSGEFRVAMEPELRFAPSGVAVCKIRAVASSRKQVDGEWVDDRTCWVNLTGFKKIGENMVESFEKGDLVVVTGKMQTEDWEDSNGNKRTSVGIIVDVIGPAVTFYPARPVGRQERATASAGAKQGGGSQPPPGNDPWASEEPPF